MDPVVTPAEMAAIDAAAPEPVEELIERAGWAVARQALAMLGGGYGKRVLVVAGKGNNGADGVAAARFLRARGARVEVLTATDPAASDPAVLPPTDLLIDAAYGTGFRGAFSPAVLPQPAPPVLAVDIPSGVSGLTGEAHGRPWPATVTVTFAAPKPGLLLGQGAELAGRVVVADIGLDTSTVNTWHLNLSDLAPLRPRRERGDHKWRHAVWVVAGSPGMAGAAALCARAAQRGGAGYVRVTSPGVDAEAFAPTEAVVVAAALDGWVDLVKADAHRFGALAVGPGLGRGPSVDGAVRRLVAETTQPLVIDADALVALGGVDTTAGVIGARGDGAAPVVLTPHDGEFASLTGGPPGPDRFAAVRDLAAATGAVVLLKGPTTIVAEPAGQAVAVDAGDVRLASAGTGDVLTGVVAALLAGRADTTPRAAMWSAAAAAVLHGRAGALASPRGLVASDLLDHLPTALSEAFGG